MINHGHLKVQIINNLPHPLTFSPYVGFYRPLQCFDLAELTLKQEKNVVLLKFKVGFGRLKILFQKLGDMASKTDCERKNVMLLRYT